MSLESAEPVEFVEPDASAAPVESVDVDPVVEVLVELSEAVAPV